MLLQNSSYAFCSLNSSKTFQKHIIKLCRILKTAPLTSLTISMVFTLDIVSVIEIRSTIRFGIDLEFHRFSIFLVVLLSMLTEIAFWNSFCNAVGNSFGIFLKKNIQFQKFGTPSPISMETWLF